MTARMRILGVALAACAALAVVAFLLCRPRQAHPGRVPQVGVEATGLGQAEEPIRPEPQGTEPPPDIRQANQPPPATGGLKEERPTVRLADRVLSDFENGTDQGWSCGAAVEGGQESKFALQCTELGKPMALDESVRMGEKTSLSFGFYTDRALDETQFFGWCPAEGDNFRYIIWDYEPGEWVEVRIRLSELFTWKGLHEPVGNVLENIVIWPKGPPEAVVRIDNVRVSAEPQPEPEPEPEAPGTF